MNKNRIFIQNERFTMILHDLRKIVIDNSPRGKAEAELIIGELEKEGYKVQKTLSGSCITLDARREPR